MRFDIAGMRGHGIHRLADQSADIAQHLLQVLHRHGIGDGVILRREYALAEQDLQPARLGEQFLVLAVNLPRRGE